MFLFKVNFDNPEIPAPYRHSYSLTATSVGSGLEVSYDLKYLERDTIDEEEIFEEGFTLEDDYSWKGILKPVWREAAEKMAEKSSFKKNDVENSPLTVALSDSREKMIPEKLKEWEYFLQELTQAIFEESGREAPLVIHYLSIRAGNAQKYDLNISFASRSISLSSQMGGASSTKEIVWNEGRSIMTVIYAADYDGENALLKTPKKEGNFIDIGEGVWYQLGISCRNPSKKNDVVGKIARFFDA